MAARLALQAGNSILLLNVGGGLLLDSVVDYPDDVITIDTAPRLTLTEFVPELMTAERAARIALSEFVAGVTAEEIAPWVALEEWLQ
jgi:hypothetical protein